MVRRRRIIWRRRWLAFPIVLHARQHRRHAGHARGSRLAATRRRCGRFDDVDGGRRRQAAARRSIGRWDAAADRWTGGSSGSGSTGSDVGEVADALVGEGAAVHEQQQVVGPANESRVHGPNLYKDTKPWMSAFLKNWPVKVLVGRCLSVWGPRSPHPVNTEWIHIPVLIHTGKGGRERANQREG